MSKHDQAIFYKVRCSDTEQRDRLKAKAKEVASLMELENAEMLETLLNDALPRKTKSSGPNPLAATDGS